MRHEGRRAVQKPWPYESEQQKCRKQPGAQHHGCTTGDDRRGGPNEGGAFSGTAPGRGPTDMCASPGPGGLRQMARVLHDLLGQFGLGQDGQQLGCPSRHEIVTAVPAGSALAYVACQGQPQWSRQHHAVAPNALISTAIALSGSDYLPEFPAPGSLVTQPVLARFRSERGDLESAKYRLPVLAAQPWNLGDLGAQLPRRAPAIQTSFYEQLIMQLPGLGQRGHHLVQPVLQRCLPRRRVLHIRHVGNDVGLHRCPVDVIDPGRQSGREPVIGRDA